MDIAAVTFNVKVDTEVSSLPSILLTGDVYCGLIWTGCWQLHPKIHSKKIASKKVHIYIHQVFRCKLTASVCMVRI